MVAAGCQGGGGGEHGGERGLDDRGGGHGSREGEATLVFGRGFDSVGLDPAHEVDGESFKVIESLFDGLVRYREGSTEIEPALATRWEMSADGLTWTFFLRPGVRFHDGTRLDAEAVFFSFARQMDLDPPHPFHQVGGNYPFWRAMGMDDVVADIAAVDSLTVVFTLKKPSAPFLANLAMPFASVVSPTAVAAAGEDFFKHPVGTGPFRFVDWVKDDHITLAGFADYWGGKPALDRLIFRSIPENSVRFLAFTQGDLDGMDGIVPDDVAAIERDGRFTLLRQPGLNVAYVAMQCEKPPFNDVRVRRAVNHAVNREGIIHALYRGLGSVAAGPLPPTIWGFHSQLTPYPYDPERARELLAEAGHPAGLETTLWTMVGPRPYMPEPQKVAQAVQADLAQVGIRARIVTYEWGTYLDLVQHGKHDLCLLGWTGDNGDPDNFLYALLDRDVASAYPSTNVAFYKGEEMHALIMEAQRSLDHERRVACYVKAQEIARRDAPWCPLAHMTDVIAFQRLVRGFTMHPTGQLRFGGVTLAGEEP
jgi:peptide/nickel transport system substrate-binding protein